MVKLFANILSNLDSAKTSALCLSYADFNIQTIPAENKAKSVPMNDTMISFVKFSKDIQF
jgi:hypothetical protein